MRPILVAVAGGSGSGKTTFIQLLETDLVDCAASVVPADNYYFDLSAISPSQRETRNYDHPDAIDWELMHLHMSQLAKGLPVDMPIYDFATHTRQGTKRVEPLDVILYDGILLLYLQKIRAQFDYSVFIDVPDDLRFIRRLRRDIRTRGRSVDSVSDQYLNHVRPMHHTFVDPSKALADVCVDWTSIDHGAVKRTSQIIRGMRDRRRQNGADDLV